MGIPTGRPGGIAAAYARRARQASDLVANAFGREAMKLVEHFNTFMTDVVNLNTTRVTQLENSIEALKGALRASDWEPKIKCFKAQGSWAHKTIIKPVDNKAFDADLLVFIEPVTGWTPKNYLSSLRSIFTNNSTYTDKVRRYSHCVTIEYAGEREIDIAPCVVDRDGVTRMEVCNFSNDEFEISEPEKYTNWLIERNGWTGGNGLRKVTRLLKYLRDIKGTFSCPSVLFTTVLGERITRVDGPNTVDFADLPTALKTIVGRLDDWLQANPSRPTVTNPELASEVLSELWDDARYANFRDKIQTYRTWIDEAYSEADRDESIGKWRRVFGDDFAKSSVVEKAASVSDQARELLGSAGLTKADGDLVTLFTQFGRSALPEDFDRLPHKKRPPWRSLRSPSFQVSVAASQYRNRDGILLDRPASGTGPLPKHNWLKFQVCNRMNAPMGQDYEVQWRVTNTDREAKRANALRGGFERSNDGSSRWEQLEYRGVHTVEAFIVRKRDQILVSQSEPFYVVID
jgi:hypothetical protein